MNRSAYEAPEFEIVKFGEEIKTLTQTSDPDTDGTSILVSWLIG